MDSNKIELFQRTYNQEKKFPPFKTLSKEEVNKEYRKFKSKTRYDNSRNSLINYFEKNGNYINGQNALDENLNLVKFLNAYHIPMEKYVYLVWGDFESIDKMLFTDFVYYFDDIWFPIAENLAFYFKSFKYIIFIHHEGFIYIKKV